MMAIIRNINKSPYTGNGVPWWIKETLKSAGWTVWRSGDGTGGNHQSGDIFSSYGNGSDISPATGILGYSGCWFVMEAPNGRQTAFWRSSTFGNSHDDEWAVYYSPGGLYTGGDENDCPTATDEMILFGTRPPGAPIFQVGSSANLVHVVADSDPINGEYKYCAIELIPTNSTSAVLFWDPLNEIAPTDGHPLIVGVVNGAFNVGTMANESGDRKIKIVADAGGANILTDAYYGYFRAGGQTHIQRALVSVYDNKERPMFSPGYAGGGGGWVGVSSWFEQAAVNRGYPSRDDTEAHLYLNDFLIKNFWDGSTAPLVV
jgi:hypothetical protein